MSSELRDRIRALVDSAPAGTMIPVSGLAELLEIDPEPLSDLTVEDVAEIVSRAPSTVRGWCADGKLRAYRFNGREWRITRDALREFHRGQAADDAPDDHGSTDDDLSSWRRAS